MSIIIIPSKNIYNIDHNKVPKNAIGSIEKFYNNIKTEFGNVLSKEYRFRYLSYNGDVDISTLPALYENPKYTEGFNFDLQNGVLKAHLKLSIDKLTYFETEGSKITSHQIKRTQKLISPKGSLFDTAQLIAPILSVTQEYGYVTLGYETNVQVGENFVVEETISLVGNYYVPEETSTKVGNDKDLISISSNELVQADAQSLNRYANDILLQYANGKETATILCDISEYYDTNGDLVISTKTSDKMTFEHYDRVIPMVRNAQGKDVPLSCDEYGMAKVFEIVGVKVYFDGAVWQEVTLRETGEKEYVYITEKPYLTFSSKSEFNLRTENSLKNWDGTLQYSTDTKKWNVWDGTTITSLNGKLYLRGIGNTFITGESRQGFRFVGTDIECQGNIETLLDYIAVKEKKHPPMAPYCFSTLFNSEYALIKPPSLPATELSQYCYHQMFLYCDNLIALPRLPATKLAYGCYTYMFSDCGKIKINLTPNAEDVKYRIPVGGNITQDAGFADTFQDTGGTFTGTPSINTDYYTPNELV